MFGSSFTSGGSSNGSSIIKSGYDTKNQLDGLSNLKSLFSEALMLRPEDCNEATLEKYSNMEGKVRGFNALVKRVSKQKLNTARAIGQTHQLMWQHAQNAAQQEIQWQQTAARNLEQMSEKMLDMNTVQQSHAGFTKYLDTADRIITY